MLSVKWHISSRPQGVNSRQTTEHCLFVSPFTLIHTSCRINWPMVCGQSILSPTCLSCLWYQLVTINYQFTFSYSKGNNILRLLTMEGTGAPLPTAGSGAPFRSIDKTTISLHLPFSIMTVPCQRSQPPYRPVRTIFVLFLYRYSV